MPILIHLVLEKRSIIALMIMIETKYKIIYKMSLFPSVMLSDCNTLSIRGYIVLPASNGAIKPNTLLLTATKITEVIQ